MENNNKEQKQHFFEHCGYCIINAWYCWDMHKVQQQRKQHNEKRQKTPWTKNSFVVSLGTGHPLFGPPAVASVAPVDVGGAEKKDNLWCAPWTMNILNPKSWIDMQHNNGGGWFFWWFSDFQLIVIFWVRNVTFPGCMKQGNPQRKDLKFPDRFYFFVWFFWTSLTWTYRVLWLLVLIMGF